MDKTELYQIYKDVENTHKNKKVSIKPFDKLSQKHQEIFEKISDYFSTIYQNINPYVYIENGFKMWKSFNPNMLDDKRLFDKYVANDKRIKRNFDKDVVEKIEKSIKFIKSNFDDLYDYCECGGIIRKPIADYMNGDIDAVTLMYLENRKFLKINNEEKNYLSYYIINRDKIKHLMYKNYDLLIGRL